MAVCEWEQGEYGRLLWGNGEGGGLNCKADETSVVGALLCYHVCIGSNDLCDARCTPECVVRDPRCVNSPPSEDITCLNC